MWKLLNRTSQKPRLIRHICFHPAQTFSGKRNTHRIVLTRFRAAVLNHFHVIASTLPLRQPLLTPVVYLPPCFSAFQSCFLLPHTLGEPLYMTSLLDTQLPLTLSLHMHYGPSAIYFPYCSQGNLLQIQIWLRMKTQILNMIFLVA